MICTVDRLWMKCADHGGIMRCELLTFHHPSKTLSLPFALINTSEMLASGIGTDARNTKNIFRKTYGPPLLAPLFDTHAASEASGSHTAHLSHFNTSSDITTHQLEAYALANHAASEGSFYSASYRGMYFFDLRASYTYHISFFVC